METWCSESGLHCMKSKDKPGLDFLAPPLKLKAASGLPLLRSIADATIDPQTETLTLTVKSDIGFLSSGVGVEEEKEQRTE